MPFTLALSPEEFMPSVSATAELPLIAEDELISLLHEAAESELDGLVACLVERGGATCQLKGLNIYKQNKPHHRIYLNDIVADLQKFGANTLASTVFRGGKGVLYSEIVQDVASRLNVGSHGTTAEIEQRIIGDLGQKYWKDSGPEQRLALLEQVGVADQALVTQPLLPAAIATAVHVSGFAAYQFTVIVANAVAHTLLGHGLSLAANAVLTKSLSVFAGPPAWCLSGFLLSKAAAGEAYRVTVPAVFQIALIRSAVQARREQRQQPQPRKFPTYPAVIVIALAVASVIIIELLKH